MFGDWMGLMPADGSGVDADADSHEEADVAGSSDVAGASARAGADADAGATAVAAAAAPSALRAVTSLRELRAGGAESMGVRGGYLFSALWGAAPRAAYSSEAADGSARDKCIFGACAAQGRSGWVRLAHAVRAHPERVAADGHTVAISTGYLSRESATAALHEYSKTLGVRWRGLGAHGSEDRPFECACVTTLRSDVRALGYVARADARRLVDAAARPVAPGDTTGTDVFRRKRVRELGDGRVPRPPCASCTARANVFFSGGAWHFEVFSIHTHELSPDVSRFIGGDELYARAVRFVADTRSMGLSPVLHAVLEPEGRSVSAMAVAVAVSRAGRVARDAPVPCNLSLLRLCTYLPRRATTLAGAAFQRSLVVNARTGRSGVVNYMFHRINERRGGVAPTLTATASSDWYVRDEHGVRVVVALEAGALHGYPQRVIEGMLGAAHALVTARVSGKSRAARADALVRRAIGDGFHLLVVTDCVYRMLRARLRARLRTPAVPTALADTDSTSVRGVAACAPKRTRV